MEKENYETLAKIYNLRLDDIRNSNVLPQEEKDLVEYHILALINALADYFEKKDEIPRHPECGCMENRKDFNKEQFLKDCGVEWKNENKTWNWM